MVRLTTTLRGTRYGSSPPRMRPQDRGVRHETQLQQESVRVLARPSGVSPNTIRKGRKRTTAVDATRGSRQPRPIVLTPEQEIMLVAFRKHTLLPLDDCLYALQPTIPHLTRPTLHRCLERHGISRSPSSVWSRARAR